MNAPIIAAALALCVFSGNSQEKQQEKPADKMSCPMHEQRKASQGVVERGDKVMGFSHEKTMHHFRLYSDGGRLKPNAMTPKTQRAATKFARISGTLPRCLRRWCFSHTCSL